VQTRQNDDGTYGVWVKMNKAEAVAKV